MTNGKLVRDGIPDIMRASGVEPIVHTLQEPEVLDALFAKLAEEAEELRSAPDAERLEELADLFEVVRAIANHLGIELQAVEREAARKRHERGGFSKGLWLACR